MARHDEVQPPILVDGELRLSHLRYYAGIFDEISGQERYNACDFIDWLRVEIQLESRRGYHAPAGRPGQMKAVAVA